MVFRFYREETFDSLLDPPKVRKFALPQSKNFPALSAKPRFICEISLAIPAELFSPILNPGLRNMGVLAAFMMVPKASIDLNNSF